MKPHLARRIAALQSEIIGAGLDAVVFTDRENLIYYAGTTEIECMAAVIPATGSPIFCCLWLDEPYVRECSGAEKLLAYRFPTSNLGQTIVSAMRTLGLTASRVGFHKYFVEFSVFDAIRQALPNMEFRPAMDLTYRVRAVKDETELACLQTASDFLSLGMEAAVAAVRPGITEIAVLAEAEYAMRKAGSEGATFRMQVLTHAKQLQAHPYAGDVVIQNDQPVVIHLGSSYRGYAAKMCRTVALGNIPDETRKIYELLKCAQQQAVAALVPGVCVAEIYDLVHACVAEHGYGSMILDQIGYGVGIRQSEFFPIIGKGLSHVIAKDMVVDLLLPTVFKPGVGGPRVTDMIHVTESGGTFMTTFPRELIDRTHPV
jgi:Xaa-Pro aminopeptidase